MVYHAKVTLPTGISPHYAWFGREMNLGIDTDLIKEVETTPGIQSHTSELVKKLQVTHEVIQQNLKDSQIPMKKYYDIGTEEPKFEIGSKVLLHHPTTKPWESPKFK